MNVLEPFAVPPVEGDCPPAPEPKPGRKRRERRTYSRHGLVTLKATVRALGPRVIDKRTTLGKQLAAWRGDLIRDLGGDVSTQQAAVIHLAVKTKLMLDSIDTWLLVQPSLINARKRALLPVVRERQQLAAALARYLTQLGLERRAKDVDVAAQLAALRRVVPAQAPTSPADTAAPTSAPVDGADE